MVRKAVVIWIAGLLSAVPYATYHLLFRAPKEQYALLITFVLFWVFGYWGMAGPLIALVKVRRVFRAIEQATSGDDLLKTLQSPEARDVAIEHIAVENHIPRFLAVRVYDLLVARLVERPRAAVQGSTGGA
jgi:hypothetical protein